MRADFLSMARGFAPAGAEPAPASKSAIPEETFAAGRTEGAYFVAWLLFFLCVSISTSLASSAIGAGSAAIFRTSGSSPLPAVYVIAGISFLLSGLVLRLLPPVHEAPRVPAAGSAYPRRELSSRPSARTSLRLDPQP